MTSIDPETTVTALLAAAQLTIPDEELAVLIADFPTMRKLSDEMYLPELDAYEPAVKFDPTTAYAAS